MGTIYNSVPYNQSNLGGTKYKGSLAPGGSGNSKNLADILEPNGEYGDLNVIKKFNSFGWYCIEIDGHSEEEITKALNKKHNKKPIFILAKTIKGKGCKIMENNPEWHHKTPNEEELKNLFMDLQ